MDLFLAISQGIGTSLAAGVRALLAPLFVGLLARAERRASISSSTGFEWLEATWWLVLLLVAVRWPPGCWSAPTSTFPMAMWAVAAMGLGGVLFAGLARGRGLLRDHRHRAPAWSARCWASSPRGHFSVVRWIVSPRAAKRRTTIVVLRRSRHAGDCGARGACCRADALISSSRSASGCCSPVAAARGRSTKASESCGEQARPGIRRRAQARDARARGRGRARAGVRGDPAARQVLPGLRERVPLRDARRLGVDHDRHACRTRHGVPSICWYHRGERRYVDYGSSGAAVRTFGVLRATHRHGLQHELRPPAQAAR